MTGPRKELFHIGKRVLLQTVVDAVLAQRVEEASNHEGISRSAFLRRLLEDWARQRVVLDG